MGVRTTGCHHMAFVTNNMDETVKFYDTETWMMLLRGPGSPWARLQHARRLLDQVVWAEIERRRTSGEVSRS